MAHSPNGIVSNTFFKYLHGKLTHVKLKKVRIPSNNTIFVIKVIKFVEIRICKLLWRFRAHIALLRGSAEAKEYSPYPYIHIMGMSFKS